MKNLKKGIFIGISKNINEPVRFIEYYDKSLGHKNILGLGKIGLGLTSNYKLGTLKALKSTKKF